MSQNTAATDGGTDDDVVELAEVEVTTVENLVTQLDEDGTEEVVKERATRIMEVLEETGATLLQLQSSWHGNEYIGDWQEFWFAHIDFQTDKAVHMSECVEASYPMRMVGKLHDERNRASPSDRRIDRYESRAFKNWEQAEQKTASWGGPKYTYVTDEYCPNSSIDVAITAPSRDDHYVFTNEGNQRGTLEEADLIVRKTTMHEYESRGSIRRDEKFTVEGESYEAFVSANLKNVLPFMPVENEDGEVIEQGTFHDYTGDQWVVAMDGLKTFIDYATEAGFTVSVHSDYQEKALGSLDGN